MSGALAAIFISQQCGMKINFHLKIGECSLKVKRILNFFLQRDAPARFWYNSTYGGCRQNRLFISQGTPGNLVPT